jgi:hypothetical protein
MNRLTNYLLICIALFFGLAILSDRLSKLHLFEGMTDDAESKPTNDSVDLTDSVPVTSSEKKKVENKDEESFVTTETPVITHPF